MLPGITVAPKQLQQLLDRKHCTSCTRPSARKELPWGAISPSTPAASAKVVHAGEHSETAAAQEGGEGWRWIGVHMAECSTPEDTATRTMSVHGAPKQHRQHCLLPRQRGTRVASMTAVRRAPGHVPSWPWSTAATRFTRAPRPARPASTRTACNYPHSACPQREHAFASARVVLLGRSISCGLAVYCAMLLDECARGGAAAAGSG
jgi:hypothetical protein